MTERVCTRCRKRFIGNGKSTECYDCQHAPLISDKQRIKMEQKGWRIN